MKNKNKYYILTANVKAEIYDALISYILDIDIDSVTQSEIHFVNSFFSIVEKLMFDVNTNKILKEFKEGWDEIQKTYINGKIK